MRPTHPRIDKRGAFRFATLLSIALATFSVSLEASAQDRSGPPQVAVAQPLVRTIVDFDYYTGRFFPTQQVVLQARVSGYLRNVAFREGGLVEAGQLLFELDPRPLEAEVAQREAELAQAVATRGLAANQEERALELRRRQIGSVADADTARAAMAQSEASVAVAEARLAAARLNLSFARITAPFAGRISATRVDVGNLVTPQSELARLVAVDPVEFRFTVPEAAYIRYNRLARSGERLSARTNETEVAVRLADERRWQRRGTMSFVDNVLDPNSGTIEGRAMFSNDDLFLTPGIYGRLRIPATGTYEAVLIPDVAISSDQDRKIVYTIDGEGAVAERVVELGPLHQNMRVVRAGLDGSERVVVRGLLRVRAGATVDPREETLELSNPSPAAAARRRRIDEDEPGKDAPSGTGEAVAVPSSSGTSTRGESPRSPEEERQAMLAAGELPPLEEGEEPESGSGLDALVRIPIPTPRPPYPGDG